MAVVALIAAGAPAHAAPAKPKAAPEALVVADAIAEGVENFRPLPGRPVYYVLRKVQLTVGESVAGIKMPDPAVVEKSIVAALATQGFVRTEVGGPLPSIFIVASWGDANFANLDDLPDPTDTEAVAQTALLRKTSGATRDRYMVEQLVGTNKRGTGSLSFEGMDKLRAASNEDRLYISLAALDVPAFKAKKRVLLWRTSVTVDGRNKLAEALPVMLESAAPFFGTNSDSPVFVDDKARRAANVEIGELKVVPDNSTAPPGEKPKK